MLKASYLLLEINEFGSYEARIEESEKVHIEDCENWWSSSFHGSVAEHWRLKPGVVSSTHGSCRPFHFSPHNTQIHL